MNSKVSVIIPVYNVEEYLERCVNSVISQSLSDIEIILVDDGSKDSSGKLCDILEMADNRIKVIHKKNGGLASARNAGLHIAKGKYIFFLDSDDWIDNNALYELVEIAEKYSVDFVRFRPKYANWPQYEDGELCDFGTERGIQEGLYKKKQIESDIYPRLFATKELTLGVIVAAWRSLYNREFLIKNNLYFDDEVRYSEDTIFSAKVVRKTNSFYYLDGARYYNYFYNDTSITKSFRKDRWECYKKLMQCFENEFRNCKDYDFTQQLLFQKMYCILSALSQRNAIKDVKERENYCSIICTDPITIQAMKYINEVNVSKGLKLMLWLIKLKQVKLLARWI